MRQVTELLRKANHRNLALSFAALIFMFIALASEIPKIMMQQHNLLLINLSCNISLQIMVQERRPTTTTRTKYKKNAPKQLSAAAPLNPPFDAAAAAVGRYHNGYVCEYNMAYACHKLIRFALVTANANN